MSAILKANALNFSYTDRPVLSDVSLSLSAGQIVALLGPNGSGKTTLIRALLDHVHASGSVQWDGKELSRWNRKHLARRVAYLPQSPTADPEHRVIDVLRLGRAPYWHSFGLESTHDADVVQRVANQLQLADLLDRRIDRLSGGQRQRVFLGRCLAQEPAALLLDEPSTFLDLKHQMDLGLLLQQLVKEQNLAVLMAVHDLNLATTLADRIILLKEGKVVREGTPNDVMDPAILQDVYQIPMERITRSDGTPLVFPKAP